MTTPTHVLEKEAGTVRRTIKAYDEIAATYAATWFDDPVMEPLLGRFYRLLEVPRTVLDAGCGPGRDVLALNNRGCDVVGIDLSLGMVAQARNRVRDQVFRGMDMRSLRF